MWLETLGPTCTHGHTYAYNWFHKESLHPLRLQTRRTSSCQLKDEQTNCLWSLDPRNRQLSKLNSSKIDGTQHNSICAILYKLDASKHKQRSALFKIRCLNSQYPEANLIFHAFTYCKDILRGRSWLEVDGEEIKKCTFFLSVFLLFFLSLCFASVRTAG